MMAEYAQFQTLIQERVGLHFDAAKQQDLMRRVQAAMKVFEISDYNVFYNRLSGEAHTSSLWTTLTQHLTINETYFFRDAGQINALHDHILPALIQKRRQEGYLTLRLWSAGCASGEEPYTLAILLHKLLPDLAKWNILILGTDINRDCLATAEKGFYSRHAFRKETPEIIQHHYFKPDGKGFRLLPAIQQMVRFGYLNLVDDIYPSPHNFTGNLDLIICRNVTIYFERPTTRQIIERFHRALVPDGWLVVGHSEPMTGFYEGFSPRNYEGAVVYQKAIDERPAFILPEPLPVPVAQPRPAVPVVTVQEPTPRVTLPSAQECYEKGKTFADRMAWEEAIHWLSCALTLNPLMLEAHFTRALVHTHRGDHAAALQSLERTLYLNRNFVMGHFNIGLIRHRLGQQKEAVRAWSTVCDLIGGNLEEILPYGEGVTGGYLLSVIDTYLKNGK